MTENPALNQRSCRIYLGGPINGCTDEEAHGWRESVKDVLDDHGLQYADPMDRDYRGRELEPGIAAEIVDGDKEDIQECDVLLMNAPKPSYGTAMEIFYGALLGKTVVVVLPEGATLSPWVIEHADQICFGSAVKAAVGLCGSALVDPIAAPSVSHNRNPTVPPKAVP